MENGVRVLYKMEDCTLYTPSYKPHRVLGCGLCRGVYKYASLFLRDTSDSIGIYTLFARVSFSFSPREVSCPMLALRSMHSAKEALRCEPLAAAVSGIRLLAPHLLTLVMVPTTQQRLAR